MNVQTPSMAPVFGAKHHAFVKREACRVQFGNAADSFQTQKASAVRFGSSDDAPQEARPSVVPVQIPHPMGEILQMMGQNPMIEIPGRTFTLPKAYFATKIEAAEAGAEAFGKLEAALTEKKAALQIPDDIFQFVTKYKGAVEAGVAGLQDAKATLAADGDITAEQEAQILEVHMNFVQSFNGGVIQIPQHMGAHAEAVHGLIINAWENVFETEKRMNGIHAEAAQAALDEVPEDEIKAALEAAMGDDGDNPFGGGGGFQIIRM